MKNINIKLNFTDIFGLRFLNLCAGLLLFGAVSSDLYGKSSVRVVNYEVTKIDLGGKKSIHVEGYFLGIKVVQNSRMKKLKLKVKRVSQPDAANDWLEKWNLKINKDGEKLRLIVHGPHEREDWKNITGGRETPKFELEIHSPPLALSLFTSKGNVVVKNWDSPIHVVAHQADVKISGGEGPSSIFTRSGKVIVGARSGKLKVESFNGQIQVAAHQGQVFIESFSGKLIAKKITGQVKLNTFKGIAKLTQIDGGLEFKSEQGLINISKFKGRLRGESNSGMTRAEILGSSDVSLKSLAGEVRVKLRSGAYVNAGTKEGILFLPSRLKLTRYPNLKIRRGALGVAKGGKLRIRTLSGNIRVSL